MNAFFAKLVTATMTALTPVATSTARDAHSLIVQQPLWLLAGH